MKERYAYYLDDKKHEVRDGLDEEFFNNGNKKGEIPWQDGKENGLVVYYYADGRKSYEANYKEGKKNGYATVWYQNGQKQWQTVFREGLTNGVWRVMGRYPTGRTGEVYVRQRDGRVPSINPRRLQLVPVVEKPMQPLSSPVRPRPQSADSMPSSFTRKISTLFGGMGPAPRSP